MTDSLDVSIDGYVGIIEIRRPPTNFFDLGTLAAITDAAFELDRTADCRAIVLCSEGKHFCAGADFSQGGLGEQRVKETRLIYQAAQRIFEIPVPVVAAVQGSAVGGGLGLACAADFRVAAPSSRFHANFSALGFHQGFGLSVSLPRIVGPQIASRLLLTAERLTGEAASDIGLVDVLVADGEVRESATQLARTLASRAPLAVRSIRETLRAGLADEVREVLEREIGEQARLWPSDDCAEGIAANLERRPARFHAR